MTIATMFRRGQFHLLHPDLRNKDRAYLVLRSSIFSRYYFPAEERISWYGGAIREDGGNGMYMTEPQARAWKNWVKSVHSIGPN